MKAYKLDCQVYETLSETVFFWLVMIKSSHTGHFKTKL